MNDTLKGPGCRCRIVHETITREDNSGSLKAFCAGDYRACPVWQREKRAIKYGTERALAREILRSTPGAERPT